MYLFEILLIIPRLLLYSSALNNILLLIVIPLSCVISPISTVISIFSNFLIIPVYTSLNIYIFKISPSISSLNTTSLICKCFIIKSKISIDSFSNFMIDNTVLFFFNMILLIERSLLIIKVLNNSPLLPSSFSPVFFIIYFLIVFIFSIFSMKFLLALFIFVEHLFNIFLISICFSKLKYVVSFLFNDFDIIGS